MWDYRREGPTDALLRDLLAALDAQAQEIAIAREACPIVRRQDYFDASLLTLIEQEISQLFWMQSRAETAEAECQRLRQELDEARARFDQLDRECAAALRGQPQEPQAERG